MEDFGCPSCFQIQDVEVAWLAVRSFTRVADLIEESHFSIRIAACPACAQRYVKVFTETIDFVNGEDPQYWTVMPLTKEESEKMIAAGENVSEGEIKRVGFARRHLVHFWPSDASKQTVWRDGALSIGPHH